MYFLDSISLSTDELIEFAVKHNRFGHSFGIGYHYPEQDSTKQPRRTFETNCSHLADALHKHFPNLEAYYPKWHKKG
jgi:hypothetical protein